MGSAARNNLKIMIPFLIFKCIFCASRPQFEFNFKRMHKYNCICGMLKVFYIYVRDVKLIIRKTISEPYMNNHITDIFARLV